MPSAHCVSTSDGIILAADRGFLDLVGRAEADVLGMSYREMTHPDDLDRSRDMLLSLVERAAPIRLQKRYIRPDGTTVVANIYVTRFSNPDRLVSTLFWNETGRDLPPARLWEMALRLQRLRQVRHEQLGGDLATDPAGYLLNAIYLAEAEGRVVGLSEIAEETGLSQSLAARWVKLMTAQGLLETCTTPERNVQFTHHGMARMERILASAYDVPVSH